jgi:Protein of unknown function (DUF2000)
MYAVLAMIDSGKPFGVGVNALAHACVGMGVKLGGSQPNAGLDDVQIRVIRCSQEQLRKHRDSASSGGFAMVDFTHTMTGDTYVEQLVKTKGCPPEGLDYYAVVVAGDPAGLDKAFPTQDH